MTTRPFVLKAAAIVALVVGGAALGQVQPPADEPARPANEPPGARAASPEAPGRREPDIVVDDVLRQLSATLGKDFIVDPRVPPRLVGRGTIDGPIDYEALLTILANNGFVAVEFGGYITIMPDAISRQLPSRIVQIDDPAVPDQELVTRLIAVPPGGIDAPMLVPLLRPMLPQYAHLAALPAGAAEGRAGSVLIIVDRYANVKRITRLVDELVRTSAGGDSR